MKNQKFEAQT